MNIWDLCSLNLSRIVLRLANPPRMALQRELSMLWREARIKQKIPVVDPVIKWLIEHTAKILTRYSVNTDGRRRIKFSQASVPRERIV